MKKKLNFLKNNWIVITSIAFVLITLALAIIYYSNFGLSEYIIFGASFAVSIEIAFLLYSQTKKLRVFLIVAILQFIIMLVLVLSCSVIFMQIAIVLTFVVYALLGKSFAYCLGVCAVFLISGLCLASLEEIADSKYLDEQTPREVVVEKVLKNLNAIIIEGEEDAYEIDDVSLFKKGDTLLIKTDRVRPYKIKGVERK